ncbi:unnamed protein product [Cylindrotheca closterium]|uniref:Calpain catalytic domain-containing protein n=1 Tax=Cylindrotheca closterium TaxID=2856 RepID=A0AAD2G9I2_9STRA|nr:unnamed protein product [Cylindrotheca closterium]
MSFWNLEIMDPRIDVAFELLEKATLLEKDGSNRIEAATKYYEAVYLMKEVLQRTPQTQQFISIRNLLEQKIMLYSESASRLYFDDNSAPPSIISDPRSPVMGEKKFFNEEQVEKPSRALIQKATKESIQLNRLAANANSRLSRAMDLDESGESKDMIVDAYLAAAKLYLDAIRIAETMPNSSVAVSLKGFVQGALDRVEVLKKTMSEDKLSRDIPKTQKKQINSPSLSAHEKKILMKSSLIASGLFLPWSDEDEHFMSSKSSSLSRTTTELFRDKELLELSEKQKQHFSRWARPSEIMAMRERSGRRQQAPVLIQSISPYSIRQNYVTDCSFIASLCICAAYEKRFRRRLITSIIYPQNENGIPVYNPAGKYTVKLWLNGVARKVVVDDLFPVDAYGRLLCSDTRPKNDVLELWVSVIEKAYMKLCGGYDFPGSNSGVDLFSLTGWIPERIFFPENTSKVRDFETEPERAWDRLYSANSFGDCLITVSATPDMNEARAKQLGLFIGHAYAVLDVVQVSDGTRLLQMKNPWAKDSWKGKYSTSDPASWKNSVLAAEIKYDVELAAKHDDGVFWICWDDVLKYFQNIQLSWNPKLFPSRSTIHGFWPVTLGPQVDTFNIGENPQYVLHLSQDAINKKAAIWILISRHVTKQEQEGAEVTDFLTIHLMKNSKKKERVWYPQRSTTLVHGAYTNNPHGLIRYDVSGPEDEYIALVLSQHNKTKDLSYTLSCFCTESFSLDHMESELPNMRIVNAKWTAENAKGPVGKEAFFFNPMYVMTLSQDSTLQLRCSTMKGFAVNVMLIRVQKTGNNDFRQASMKYGKIALDSGNYRHGFAVTNRAKVAAGTYTIVVSTFNPGQVGPFSVRIASSTALQIKELV